MANLRLVGAVAIKVRPDTSKFREETQRGINQELGNNGDRLDNKVKVDVDADTTPAKAKVTRLAEEIKNKGVKLNVGIDYDGVRRAKEQIDQALKSLDNKVLSFEMNKESIAAAKRELAKLEKDAQVEFTFDTDEAGYQSILKKIRRVRQEADKDFTTTWKFDTDEASLRREEKKAQAALDKIKADKTVDIRYSDNYDGMRKAIGELDSMLEDVRKIKVTTKLDQDSLEATKADLMEMLQFADVTIKFNEDKEGYEKVLSRIKQIQREKVEKEITFSTDDKSLEEQAAKYQKLIDGIEEAAKAAAKVAPVTLEINEDLEGYKSALQKIKQIQREKLVKEITFNVDESSLEDEVKKYEKLVEQLTPPRTIDITYNSNRNSIKSALDMVKAELARVDAVKIPVEADAESLRTMRDTLQMEFDNAPIEMTINEDKKGYQSILDKIAEIRRERVAVEVKFDSDEASLNAKVQEVKEKLRGLTKIGSSNDSLFRIGIEEASVVESERKAKDLKKKIEDMKAEMQIGIAGHLAVSAELAYLGRDRVVNYIARVNQTSVAAVEGALKGIGGINILSGFGNNLASMIGNFDTLSLKASGLAAALGSLANAGVYAGTALVRIGEGVGQSLGLLAATPAMAIAAGSALFIMTTAFDNFGDAFSNDAKKRAAAMKELPPVAREVVNSFRGLYNDLQRPVQDAFWDRMHDTLLGVKDNLIPALKNAMPGLAGELGGVMAGLVNSFNKLAANKDLEKVLGNTKGFFHELARASEPFFDGFNQFGLRGSELMPRFGKWIADSAERFDRWATKASESGQILDWIDHGVNSFQNMWQVGGSVADMFKAINRAADAAGMGGLAQFNINMRETADRMLSEPWQSRAATIFEGARKGTERLSDGFHNLTGTLGSSSKWLGTVLTQLGNIGGESLSRLADLLGQKTYQEGISAELAGVQTLVEDLGPSFKSLGDIIGAMGKISGSVLGSLAPVLNQIMGVIDDTISTLSDNLQKVAPKALASFSGLFGAITPLIGGLADALNAILGVVASMPTSFVALSSAAAAFFALRGLASKFFESFQQTDKFKELEGNWIAQQVAAGNTVDKYRMVDGELKKFTVPTEKFNATTALWTNMSSSVGGVRDQIRTLSDEYKTMPNRNPFSALEAGMNGIATVAAPGFKSAMGGLLSALGGPWGLAIGAAAIGIGMFAQSQADAKADTDAMTAAIDKQTGAMSKQGLEQIAKRWTDIGKAQDGWANFTRGSTKAANETVQALGQSISQMTLEVSKGGDAAHGLSGKWQDLGDKMKVLENAGNSRRPLDQVRSDAEGAAHALGLTVEQIQAAGIKGDDLIHVAKNLEEEATKADVARLVFENLGAATGQTTVQAEQMASAMQVIGDNSTTAASKIGAINKALDLLKGGKQSAREAEVAAQSTFQSAVAQAAALKEALAGNNHLIDQTTGLIDVTSTSGLKLQQTMASAADGIKVAAMAAYQQAKDAGKPPAEAAAAAQKVIEGHKDDLKAIADAAGVDVATIQKEWDGFFGKKWELNAVFSASADKVQAAREYVEGLGLSWDDSSFEALLKAKGDPAKLTIDEVKAWAQEYAIGAYQAQLKAINPEARDAIFQAMGLANAYKDGNYTGVMKALNLTNDGVAAAWANLMSVKNGPNGAGWAAALQAYLDAVSRANAERDLATLARNRSINLIARVSMDGPVPQMIDQNYNGSLTGSRFRPQKMQMFADGGFNGFQFAQRGNAKIYPGSDTWTVFAEKPTGAEAFIPMAASKRERSTEILAEVANRFGYKLSKLNQFEDGGIVMGGNSRATGLQVHIDTFNQNANDTIEDVGRGIMRQVRNAGMVGITDGI